MKKPIVIFGAGATAACNGPVTNRILPEAFEAYYGPQRPQTYNREGFLENVEMFLKDNFHLPESVADRKADHYPGLPLLLSLIDTAIDRGQPFGGRSVDDLREVRSSLEYLIFAVLQESLKNVPEDNPYHRLLQGIQQQHGIEPRIISLNYDLLADTVLFAMALERMGEDAIQRMMAGTLEKSNCRVPNYGCDIRTPAYQSRRHDYGLLLKLHGSLNWLYCPNCHRLDIGLSETGPGVVNTYKVLDELYREVLNDFHGEVNLHDKYSCQGTECLECKSEVRPVLITPTHKKDYRNPHIANVWYQAERALRESDRVFIIGYSLPDDDVEVVYLLKRGLSHLVSSPSQITVVQHGEPGQPLEEHKDGPRYRALFGDHFDWQVGGFGEWVDRSFPS